ncbi:MAG: glutamate--tRNA ligase [Lentimicrobiaceae bacterium]|jgi:glutamyl-tRNA synthetase|nr:glutamate--tRNA ligase [Lentimicrobiaceae bacterium]
MKEIRVRFAPSPTGPLHIGGVRTALYNYLFAKKNNGKIILRIEDTDQTRFVPGAEHYIVESLDWCGIRFDESDLVGGAFGPYRQSDRKTMYKQYCDLLLANGNAYYAFDTVEELDAARKDCEQHKKIFIYNSESRKTLRNSLNMSVEEVDSRLKKGEPFVVRFCIPENTEIEMTDLIRGNIKVHSNTLDDKVLFKSDGMPTYHLANIVDDHLMKISHVIRGEEWLPSMPLHILLYKALGWEAPNFAHLPLLLKPDGNGKLSKRDGDRLGFPVFPLQWTDPATGLVSSGYRESGYYPEAFVNMLALLGWNPGTDQELFSMDELIEAFSLERVGKSGAKFDHEKTKWFNHQYLIRKPENELGKEYFEWLSLNKKVSTTVEFATKVAALIKERVNFVHELWNESFFFFEPPVSYDEQVVKKRWKENSAEQMRELTKLLSEMHDFSSEKIDALLHDWMNEKTYSMGAVMNALRLLLVGTSKGPHLAAIMMLLGKQETIKRIEIGIETLK